MSSAVRGIYTDVMSGNIGIGTTNISYPLQIYGNTQVQQSMFVSGNVGIGTTLPRQELDVTGDVRVDGTVYSGTGLMFRNRIINGDMRIDQRGSATTAVTTNGAYAMDRFQVPFSLTGGAISFAQSAVPATLAGFTKCAKLTGTTSVNVSGAGNFLLIQQTIEGYNATDFSFGTTSASSITLSFWIYSTITNTYSVGLRNNTGARSYVTNFTITNANTWQQVVITIPGDTTGTWVVDNTASILLNWCFGCGTTYQTASPNTWVSANVLGTSSTATTFGTSSVYITGVQLEKGVVATPFEYRPYPVELQLCQRYYEQSDMIFNQPLTIFNTSTFTGYIIYKVQKRSNVTPILYDATGAASKITVFTTSASTNGVAYTIRLSSISGFDVQIAGTTYTIAQFSYTVNAEL